MPTAAKLAAALSFAFFAWIVAALYWQHLPQNSNQSYGREVCALFGLLAGWWIMGPAVPKARGRVDAMGAGIRTAFAITLWAVVFFAAARMFDRALLGRYKDPLEAVMGLLKEAIALAQGLWVADVMGAILIFGLIGGAMSHWVGRRWS